MKLITIIVAEMDEKVKMRNVSLDYLRYQGSNENMIYTVCNRKIELLTAFDKIENTYIVPFSFLNST